MGYYTTSNWNIIPWDDDKRIAKVSFTVRVLDGGTIDFDNIFLIHEDGESDIEFREYTENGVHPNRAPWEHISFIMSLHDDINNAVGREALWETELETIFDSENLMIEMNVN